ncbi:MAG: type II secretion system protein N [Betaproteobacteria bacterium]|nr:MAG: type II secretion system protein N [Betaproteobacteria bacterium]
MRALFAIGLTVAALALALAILAPATLVDNRVDAMTAGRVRITNATGTVWNGAGDLSVPAANLRFPVAWHIERFPLLWAEVHGTLREQGDVPVVFEVGRDRFDVRNLALSLTADALLRTVGAPAMIGDAGGRVDVHVERLLRQHDALDGQVEARWLDASLPGPRPDARIALGDVRIDGSGRGGRLVGTIANTGGNVDIAGTVTVGASGDAGIDAQIRPRDGLDAVRRNAIAAALSMIGRADGTGAYRIAWTIAP